MCSAFFALCHILTRLRLVLARANALAFGLFSLVIVSGLCLWFAFVLRVCLSVIKPSAPSPPLLSLTQHPISLTISQALYHYSAFYPRYRVLRQPHRYALRPIVKLIYLSLISDNFSASITFDISCLVRSPVVCISRPNVALQNVFKSSPFKPCPH